MPSLGGLSEFFEQGFYLGFLVVGYLDVPLLCTFGEFWFASCAFSASTFRHDGSFTF